MKIAGATSLGGLWAWDICVNLKSRFSIFDSFRDTRVHINDFLVVKVEVANIHTYNTF